LNENSMASEAPADGTTTPADIMILRAAGQVHVISDASDDETHDSPSKHTRSQTLSSQGDTSGGPESSTKQTTLAKKRGNLGLAGKPRGRPPGPTAKRKAEEEKTKHEAAIKKQRAAKIAESNLGKTRLTVSQQEEIVRLCKAGMPQVKVAAKFQITDRTVRNICSEKKQAKMSEARERGLGDNVKIVRAEEHPELSKRLLEWHEMVQRKFRTTKKFKIVTDGNALLVQAEKICKELNLDFQPNTGWLSRWIKRHQLKSVVLHGEGGDVDVDDPELKEAIEKICKKTGDFKLENIFNMDETGLYFRLLPN